MKIVKLPKEKIDSIFKQAAIQSDYVLALYKIVFPDWDDIKKLEGFPKISEETNKYIFDKSIAFDQKVHPNVVNGGIWLNNGFGTDNNIKDWSVQPCAFTLN